MHGFNWFDRRGTEGVGFVRALRTHLTNNLPHILPDLGIIIKSRFFDLRLEHPVMNGRSICSIMARFCIDFGLREETTARLSCNREVGGSFECCFFLW